MNPLLGYFLIAAGLLAKDVEADRAAELAKGFERYWSAETYSERKAASKEISAAGHGFEAVLAHLRAGRSYASDAPKGRLLRERKGVGGQRHPYMILVPRDYTPSRRWPVRFDLHGGMGASEWMELDGAWNSAWREAFDQIVILPAGWWDSMWWEWSQAENFEAILREVRATWNVDENRTVLYGSSDGGAALFFHAMRQPDRWAGYAGHVAPPDRLVRADFRPDGQMHVSNLGGQRFLLGYGEKDRLVPLRFIEKYMALFQEHGALINWYVLDGQDHSLRLPMERERELGAFLWRTKRDPLPDDLTWSTERTDRYARRHWLVIDELEQADSGSSIDAKNILPRWGTRLQLKGPTAKQMPWGRVTLKRDGNRVVAKSERVVKFTLLISPDEFDLELPILVELNGEVVHDAKVERATETLLKWAAIDDDRTRLFAAELSIRTD